MATEGGRIRLRAIEKIQGVYYAFNARFGWAFYPAFSEG